MPLVVLLLELFTQPLNCRPNENLLMLDPGEGLGVGNSGLHSLFLRRRHGQENVASSLHPLGSLFHPSVALRARRRLHAPVPIRCILRGYVLRAARRAGLDRWTGSLRKRVSLPGRTRRGHPRLWNRAHFASPPVALRILTKFSWRFRILPVGRGCSSRPIPTLVSLLMSVNIGIGSPTIGISASLT